MAHVSIAERFAFGTPTEQVSEPRFGVLQRSGTMLVARILIGAIFLVSGFAKLGDHSGTAGHMAGVGIPAPDVLAYVAGWAEIIGGIAVMAGFLARIGAFALVAFLTITTLVFHAFWNYQGQELIQQSVQFMKNLAVIGGLLLLYAVGPGRYSIDAKLRRPLAP